MQEGNIESVENILIEADGTLVIVGGGQVDIELLRRLHTGGAKIIAADGGAHDCARAGLIPEAIVGDMDSLSDIEGWAKKTRIIKIDEQETTDFEKCLYVSSAPITIALGMTGKRFDHTMAALDSVYRHAKKRHIILVDEGDIALVVSGDFAFEVEPGDRVSVHPLGEVQFSRSEGLRHSLKDKKLAPGLRTGTSNKATEGPFEIVVAEGVEVPWLLIIERHYLDALVKKLS